MTLLSIIIPTYNAAATIDACLKSLALQTDLNQVEILVQDGNSTDDTATIVQRYQQLPIQFQQTADEGVYDAMNKAIARSSGEWLYFLGADDILYDAQVLSKLLPALAGSKAYLVHGQAWLKNAGYMLGRPTSLDQLLYEGNLCHQAVCYRRRLFDQLGGYQPRYPIWADWEFNIRCFRYPHIPIEYLPQPLAIYNDQAGLSKSEDPIFRKELPLCIKADYEKEMAALKKKKSYRLGKRLFGWLDAF